MNRRFLIVFDIDETLLNWYQGYEIDNDGEFRFVQDCDERVNAYQLLKKLNTYSNVDIALFTMGTTYYAHTIKYDFFHEIDFKFILGCEFSSLSNDKKVKDLNIFVNEEHSLVNENTKYDIHNVLLVDDKSRNAFLQPHNHILVKDHHWYERRDMFDYELEKVEKKLIKMIDKSIINDTTLVSYNMELINDQAISS